VIVVSLIALGLTALLLSRTKLCLG
jgi:branched-chain amino acid transport system permease protein